MRTSSSSGRCSSCSLQASPRSSKKGKQREPDHFNSSNDDNDSADSRSDDKSPEPEGVVLGRIGDRTYAFIALERQSGIAIFDVTDPASPTLAGYGTGRDFGGDAETSAGGDLGPEGLIFIPFDESPTGQDLLVVSYEISGSVASFRVKVRL